MKFTETLRSALDGLNANRTRSLLSMLGIVIGIAAVIIIISITQGSQRNISKSIQALGTNLINVSPGRRGGLVTKALAMATLCLSPPESSFGR